MHTPYTFTFILVLLLGVIFAKKLLKRTFFFNFFHKQDVSTLPNIQLTFITFAASHSEKSWNSTWERPDYTWVCAKQNERFRSHDFWLICGYSILLLTMSCGTLKTKTIRGGPRRARLRSNRNKILEGGFDGTGQVFLKWLLCFYLKGINV